jgi:uncharacterized membrane protein YphA (DoxX/SURF4 family)
MDDSIAQARFNARPLELPAWKSVLSAVSAILVAAFFLLAGIWKIMDPYDAAAKMVQAKLYAPLAVPAALSLGVVETFAAVLLLVPRFRRWGALISGFLLIVFMGWFAYHYQELQGTDCSCFPWLKRAVGPGFFIGDAVMLLMAACAWVWARRSDGTRPAAIILGAIAVFALSSFGVTYARQSGVEAPDPIAVNGQPYSMAVGKHFVYFFDPECGHCFQAAKAMSQYKWGETKVIGVPTVNPQFAPGFLKDTGLNAQITSDYEKLKAAFPFKNWPFGVAIENGRQKASFIVFEGDEPESSLRKLGFVQ